ncbi:MAG: ABC transporter ATP-binding protein [Pirellulaceae bacterium]
MSTKPTMAVECTDITKDFGRGDTRVRALRGINMQIPFGQMTLLVGPSGCGKTTLISIVAGLLNPTSGSVRVLGEPLEKLRGSRLVQFRSQNIGFVFQQYNLLPALNAMENVAIPLLINGVSRSKALNEARMVLKQVGLGDRFHSFPSQLSGGQQQRVAIARALIHRPRILVCDEPTAALDAKSGHNVMQLLSDVAVESDRAVIIVTHDPRVYEFGKLIIHMNDGEIAEVESGQPITTPANQ